MAGVREDEFWTIFVQCMECEKVAIRQHFAVNHQCRRRLSRAVPEPEVSDNRHHPYRRVEIDGRRAARARPLSSTNTVLIGDEPEVRPLPSLPSRHRASSPEGSFNYDPEDITIANDGSSDWGSVHGSDIEIAQEEDAEELPTAPWWIHDVPDLASDPSLPDIMTIFRGTGMSQAESNLRAQVASNEELPGAIA